MNAIMPPHPVKGQRSARTVPTSYNEADNSFEVVWTTGAAVVRFDWMDGEYYDETLSLAPGAVRLDRLNEGAPVLDSHNDRQLGALVGSVVPGSAKIVGGEGVARVRLADTPEVASIAAKIKGGHLRKVSVGYSVHEYELIDRDGQRAELRATDWEPLEISLVSVPADPGAAIRSEGNAMSMPPQQREQNRAQLPAGGVPVTAKFIREKCRTLGFSSDQTLDLVETFADGEATQADFLERAVEIVGGVNRPPLVATNFQSDNSDTRAWSGSAPVDTLATRMQGALYARFSGKAPAGESREFMGASLLEMGRGLLEARGERGVRWLAPTQLYQRFGAQTTSDFTQLLNGALNSYLTEQYAAAPSPLMQLAKSREVNDFREIQALSIHGTPEMLLVEENAEYSYAAMGESGEAYRVHTFGRIMSLSRQLLINDNLGAFTASGGWYARSASQKRADIIAAILVGNVPMSDGVALFHASHGNLAAVGTAITVASLSAGRKAMRLQKDRDGVSLIDIAPKYLVVGPAKETEAEQVLTQLATVTTSEANPFPGKLTLIVDARLPGNAWYLFADPAIAAVLEYATLRGQGDTVFTDTRMGFEVDGLETKARIDFGGGAVDFRGAYKNPGAEPA